MKLLGHETAWRHWREARAGERMHHAWLLSGKSGLGKMHFALSAARELVGAENDTPHPDIIILTRLPKDEKEQKKREDGKPFERKRNITIAQVREMQQRLTTRPTLGERRAIVIDPADDLERNASNALLKSLEEPPQGTYFLLVSHHPAKLLPTIRSRCRTLRFPAVPDQQMQDFLRDKAPEADAAARDAAIAAARGSPGKALAFIDQDLGTIAELMREIVTKGDPGFILRGKLALAIGARPRPDKLRAALDLARSTLADGIEAIPSAEQPGRIEAHGELVHLTGEAPTYNYDPGLLVMEIGTLLARAAPASEPAHG